MNYIQIKNIRINLDNIVYYEPTISGDTYFLYFRYNGGEATNAPAFSIAFVAKEEKEQFHLILERLDGFIKPTVIV